MSPLLCFSVALGGALGALCRFTLSSYIAARSDALIPLGTLAVNIAGAFFIGLLVVLIDERLALAQSWRAFLITGLLGSLTTFSAFSLEMVQLLNAGHWLAAISYTVMSVLLCVVLVFAGMSAARMF